MAVARFMKNAVKALLQFTNGCPSELSTKLSKRYHLLASNARASSEQPKGISPDPLKPGPSRPIYEIIEPPYGLIPHTNAETQAQLPPPP